MICQKCKLRDAEFVTRGTKTRCLPSGGDVVLEVVRSEYCAVCYNEAGEGRATIQGSAPLAEVLSVRVSVASVASDSVTLLVLSTHPSHASDAGMAGQWQVRRELLPQFLQRIGNIFTVQTSREGIAFLRGQVN